MESTFESDLIQKQTKNLTKWKFFKRRLVQHHHQHHQQHQQHHQHRQQQVDHTTMPIHFFHSQDCFSDDDAALRAYLDIDSYTPSKHFSVSYDGGLGCR